MDWIVTVNKNKCVGCEECADSCPGDVFDMIDNKAQPARPDDCHGCHTCEEVCEEDAVSVKEAE